MPTSNVRPVPAESAVLRRVFRGTWDELPRLLVGSVLVCLGFYLAAALVPGITPISLPVLAIATAPGATVLLRTYLRIGTDGDVEKTAASVASAGGAPFPVVVRVAAALFASAATGSLYLVARFVAVDRGVGWAIPSMLVCAAATVVVVLLAVAVLPIAAADGWRGGADALQQAVGTLARQPVPVLAGLVLPAAAVLVVSQVSATLLLLFPAPVALVIVAARLTAAPHQRDIHSISPSEGTAPS